MAEDQGDGRERTEQPTSRRRQQARDDGQVARTPEIAVAVGIIAGALLLGRISGDTFARTSVEVLKRSTAALAGAEGSPLVMVALLRQVFIMTLMAWLPFAGAVMAVVIAVQLAQTRGAMSSKALQPKFSHLSPVAGLKRLLGFEGVMQVLKSVAKIAVLGFVTWMVLSGHIAEFVQLARSGPGATGELIRSLVTRLGLTTGLALLAVAMVDYVFQWFQLEKKLRMTRDEVVREHRESEGDPIVRARMRSFARAMARKRMMQAVPTADVVVVNPTHVAVALRYDPGEIPAPVVVAMGERRIAERIRAIAEKSGVPIVQNIAVARALLATGSVGRPIPSALYVAVAEILAWVHRRHGLRHVGEGSAA